MYLRKHRRRFERPTQDAEIPDQPAPGTERPDSVPALDRVRLDRALAALPPGYRAAFVLFDVEGYSHTEIARILGCSHGTSKSQLHKARTRLRALLRERPLERYKAVRGKRPGRGLQFDRQPGFRTSFFAYHSSLFYGEGRGHD
jgi:DNA-directed RNA polymerase specialized sigma24 family protein